MHPSVLFTIVPRLILTFNAMGMSYWPMVAACYCIYIPICFLLGWLFHLFVDEPGIFIGKWLWDRTVAESWPTSWAEVKAGVVSTVKGIFSFYKRAAWTAITCGCADSKKRQKQRAKKEKTVELNTAPEALEPLVKGKEIAEVATPELAVIKEPSPGGVEWHEMTKKLD